LIHRLLVAEEGVVYTGNSTSWPGLVSRLLIQDFGGN